jgi:hypothetical protein
MFPLYFLNSKKINITYLSLPIVGLILAYFDLSKVFLANLINLLPNFLAYKVSIYLTLLELGEHSEINIINVYYCSLLFFIYFGFYLYIKNIIKNNYDILFIKILTISLFSFYFFSDMPVFAFRISEFLNIVAIIFLPNLILYFKQKELISPLIILFFLYMFYKSISLLNL